MPVHSQRRYALQEYAPGDTGRPEVEGFVAAAFRHAHQADVQSFMPQLLGLRDVRGVLRCALGYRQAGEQRLFLEQYLEPPIEAAISAGSGTRVERCDIVELGNLAGRGCRAALLLVAQLPPYLMQRGYSWITFTATKRVREILAAFDAPLLDFGPADPSRLAPGQDQWGCYYATEPRVMAGWLPHSRTLPAFRAAAEHAH